MRWVLYGVCVAVVVLAAGVVWTERSMASVETPEYQVERSDGAFEVRRYPALLVAQTAVSGPRDDAANAGFRTLASFIFGGNSDNEEISMTAPVIQTPARRRSADGPAWTVDFVMPSRFTAKTLPRPRGEAVDIRKRPAERVAAVRFSGFAGEATLQRQTEALKAWMADNGLTAAGPARFAFYDPPWRLPFMRRNEVMIPLAR
ncbi:heme-binding protein [Acuticoccus sp. MNP-M23]|uniref:SOUL family heme-binding protein n=1 Tax=Acuticoccus sp. MNP-M23 TaxID=3072793 RepID=UPI002815D6F7|nr:heme-binding protein [Acuticoccus sp. MNP-M23]WMS43390.1 heme-binding protein [Acuticoccus sp. MNP-M23]